MTLAKFNNSSSAYAHAAYDFMRPPVGAERAVTRYH